MVEHGGFEPVARAGSLASAEDAGPLLFGVGDVGFDDGKLLGVRERGDVNLGHRSRPHPEPAPCVHQSVDQAIRDRFIHVGHLHRPARLPRVLQGPLRQAGGGSSEVRVGKNHRRVVTPHLRRARDAPFGAL